jgi:voltage-gated potassium channel
MAVLDETWHDALYRTVVTASLTGLDSTPHGVGAQLLTITLVLLGVSIFGYLAAQVIDSIARGLIGGAWRENRRRKMLEGLSDHIIVCGYGRVGRRAADELRLTGVPYVVVDFVESALDYARANNDLFIDGNGAEDETLVTAGIDRARGLIVASDDDGENMYIVLSAKARRPELTVVARASSEDAERKLRLAGADRIVTPYTSAGRAMATLMMKPQVAAFMNVLSSARSPEFSIEEISVPSDCGAVGLTLGRLGELDTGATVVAVRKDGGTFDTHPPAGTVMEPGDVIVAVGPADEIRTLEQLFLPRRPLVG